MKNTEEKQIEHIMYGIFYSLFVQEVVDTIASKGYKVTDRVMADIFHRLANQLDKSSGRHR